MILNLDVFSIKALSLLNGDPLLGLFFWYSLKDINSLICLLIFNKAILFD